MEENKKAMAQAILLLSEQKVTQAEPILKELAANGDVEAKFTLAGLYLSGENGIVKNEAECIRLLKDERIMTIMNLLPVCSPQSFMRDLVLRSITPSRPFMQTK